MTGSRNRLPLTVSLLAGRRRLWRIFQTEALNGGEFAGLAEFRKQPGPEPYHQQCTDTAEHHGRHRAEPLRGQAGFELAKFVGCSYEDHVNGGDAAAHFVRSGKLSPKGPVRRISRAKTGSRATAPPNRTAKRSSEIAPRISL